MDRKYFTFCSFFLPVLLLHLSLYFFQDFISLLALVPANTLITHQYIWNLVSSCFLENSLLKVVLDGSLLWIILETFYIPSLEQFILYIIFSILTSTLGTSLICFLYFGISGEDNVLTAAYYGFGGILMSFLMITRFFNRSQPLLKAFPSLTYQNAPLLLLTFQVLISMFVPGFIADLNFSVITFFSSWTYLRFYFRVDEQMAAEEFTFVGMFPQATHLFVVPLSIAFYNICASIGVFPPLESADKKMLHHLRVPASEPNDNPAPPVQTKHDEVAERRRARAIKMLDAKMAELSRKSENWDEDGQLSKEKSDQELGKFLV